MCFPVLPVAAVGAVILILSNCGGTPTVSVTATDNFKTLSSINYKTLDVSFVDNSKTFYINNKTSTGTYEKYSNQTIQTWSRQHIITGYMNPRSQVMYAKIDADTKSECLNSGNVDYYYKDGGTQYCSTNDSCYNWTPYCKAFNQNNYMKNGHCWRYTPKKGVLAKTTINTNGYHSLRVCSSSANVNFKWFNVDRNKNSGFNFFCDATTSSGSNITCTVKGKGNKMIAPELYEIVSTKDIKTENNSTIVGQRFINKKYTNGKNKGRDIFYSKKWNCIERYWYGACKKWEFQDYSFSHTFGEGKYSIRGMILDAAGNINKSDEKTITVDRTPPSIDVNNKDYDWKTSDITITPTVTDNVSGVDKIYYRWDNSDCWNGTELTTSDITLSDEGEHTLYICAKDKLGNESTKSYGTYKLDQTPPSISFDENIPNSKLADNNNFPVKFKIFDNLDGNTNQASYNTYDVDYNYVIKKDGSDFKTSNGLKKSNILVDDNYSLTGASENYNFNITITDKAGNTASYTKNFKIYPNYLDAGKSSISVDFNSNKYANNDDYYTYTLHLKDKFGNPIYNKLFNIKQLGTPTIYLNEIAKNGGTALKYDNITTTDNTGEMTFKLKSYTPGIFKQNFEIKRIKWKNDYTDDSGTTTIEKELALNNEFKKPVSIEKLEIVSPSSFDYPQLGPVLTYRIKLKNIPNFNDVYPRNLRDDPNNIIELYNSNIQNVIKNTFSHEWKEQSVDNRSFGKTITTDNLKFTGRLEANAVDGILKAPELKITNLGITYKFKDGDKIVKYKLKDWGTLGNSHCNRTTLGVKIYGSLQGDGKSSATGQRANISDLSKGKLRAQIRANAYRTIKNMPTGENINGVLYFNGGNIKYSEVKNKLSKNDTVIVKNGNFVIDQDINKNIGIIVLKDNYRALSDYNNKGNVYVNVKDSSHNDITKINAMIYADGTFRSATKDGVNYIDNQLTERLTLNGSLFTRNTIGGAVLAGSNYTLPGGQIISDFDTAQIYDLNYVRKVPMNCIQPGQPGYDPDDGYSFIIKYNPKNQVNPPKVFGK